MAVALSSAEITVSIAVISVARKGSGVEVRSQNGRVVEIWVGEDVAIGVNAIGAGVAEGEHPLAVLLMIRKKKIGTMKLPAQFRMLPSPCRNRRFTPNPPDQKDKKKLSQ